MFIFCFLINIIIVVKSCLGRKMMNNVKKSIQKSNCCTLANTTSSIIAHFISNYCKLSNTLKPTKKL